MHSLRQEGAAQEVALDGGHKAGGWKGVAESPRL